MSERRFAEAKDEYERARAMRQRREELRKETHAECVSMLTLAGISVDRAWELANGYWPDSPDYDDVRRPWWLFQTPLGLIRIGRRKRVIEIDWSATKIRAVVTDEGVTKDETMVHAWGVEKAVTYLRSLRERATMATVLPCARIGCNAPSRGEDDFCSDTCRDWGQQ